MRRLATILLTFAGLAALGSTSAHSCPTDMAPTGGGTCIDRHEWSRPDGRPLVGASALPEPDMPDLSADTLCRSAGKRVCEREEWQRACSERVRFPYGEQHEPGRCNDEKQWKSVDEAKVAHRDRAEFARLDGSEKVGSRDGCASPSGAFDMIGNVEEWVRCREGRFGWCLVGGYWASRGSRTCESAVLIHAPRWHYYQTGFRCCSEMVGGKDQRE